MYIVKFFFLSSSRNEEHKYDSLFDAIKVAKETNIGDCGMFKPAMTDWEFNKQFWTLLTSGFIYTGKKSEEFPEGDIMVMLLQGDECEKRKGETPVFNGAIQFDYIKSLENIEKTS